MTLPLDLGTNKAIYIEDCTFSNYGTAKSYAAFDSDSGGARVVVRNNTMQGSVYAHWTGSGFAGVKYEVYHNAMTGDASNPTPVRLEAGTGVIWGNTVSGYATGIQIDERRGEQYSNVSKLYACDNTHPWDGNIEVSGWPCATQVGRGPGEPGSQPSAPLYAWNNGPEAGCRTGGACTNTVNIGVFQVGGPLLSATFLKSTAHSNGEVDYVNNGTTPKPGYTPYPYPHELQGGPGYSRRITGGRQTGGSR